MTRKRKTVRGLALGGHLRWWPVVLAVGCGGDWRPADGEDLGSVCLVTDGAVDQEGITNLQDFDANLPVEAVFQRVFNAGCDQGEEAVVVADVDPGSRTVELTSAWTWEEAVLGWREGCLSLGRTHTVRTDLGTLEEGTWTVRYGTEEVELVVPSTDRACLGGHPFGTDHDGAMP
jgi:hypothetical protein